MCERQRGDDFLTRPRFEQAVRRTANAKRREWRQRRLSKYAIGAEFLVERAVERGRHDRPDAAIRLRS
jgi:hypothetical protein